MSSWGVSQGVTGVCVFQMLFLLLFLLLNGQNAQKRCNAAKRHAKICRCIVILIANLKISTFSFVRLHAWVSDPSSYRLVARLPCQLCRPTVATAELA